MPVKIFIGNLPPDTTAEDIQELFAEIGAEADVISIHGDDDKLIATVQLDVDEPTAKIMASRRKDRIYKGRKLEVYVPVFQR